MRHIRPTTMTTPRQAHPLVKVLFEKMVKQQITMADMAQRAGLTREAVSGWRTRQSPTLTNIEACFNVLGYTLRPVPKRGGADE